MIDEILFKAESRYDRCIEIAKEDFAAIRSGRANAGMFSKIMVDYYGSATPLQQLASFQVPEARTVLVTPFDRSSMAAIEKAIRDSDLGVNPSNDGNVIRLNMPLLTEERRREYVKLAKGKAEDARVALRNGRRKAKDALETLKKDGEAGEDDVKRGLDELDKLTKKHVDLVDLLLAGKEAELLEV
ncbi:MAG: ribosome recycling factor [Promicromonosporaceae bacterium]|nr:ribosome recycling factor [Promicromonosporaceae bacterium]